MDSSAAIVVADLRKSYGEVEAVKGISFAVRRGTTTALLGGNGAGKTTTLSMLLGVLTPTAGRVTVLGAEMPGDRHRVLPRLNFTSPYVDLPKRLTVRENLAVFADLYGVRDARARIAAVAADFDLDGLLGRPYGNLSAGQRTRVSLAKAVINEPEVLLLDEPTASLDPDIGDRMRTYLEHYQRQHRLHDAARLAPHGRGRADVRRRDHAARGPRRRPGLAAGAARPLRTRQHGGSVPRHRTWPGGRARPRQRRRRDHDVLMTTAAAVRRDVGAVASLRRVRAILRRHAYLILKSWTRIVSMMYYPTVTMVVWAFVTLYLAPTNNFLKDAPGFFIGAVLLWDVLFRGQLGVSLTFIEELYARNLGNLFVSPLTLPEYIAGQLAMSVLRAVIGVGGACFFAWLLFRYSIFSLGFPLIAFFANLLVFGWAIGLAMSGMIMRLGLGAEELAWAAIFIVAPISGVYYPVAVLPGWMQAIAWATPSAHVFEGMRGVLLHGVFRWDAFWAALALNVVYLVLGALVFAWSVHWARVHGTLLQMGE